MIARLSKLLAASIAVLLAFSFAAVYFQGTSIPAGKAEYVALGSSFSAGRGLGSRPDGAPFLCGRGDDNFPHRVSEALALDLTDVSCGGSTTAQVLRGGQFFQGPQLDALNSETKLVTMIVGGNDVAYVGDLMSYATRRDSSWVGSIARSWSDGPDPAAVKDFDSLRQNIALIISSIRQRAPSARVLVLTYPQILPANGTCDTLGLSIAEADRMRLVSRQLADATRSAIADSGATLVDLEQLSAGHDACAEEPWVNGWLQADTTAFHPTVEGAAAMANAVITHFSQS